MPPTPPRIAKTLTGKHVVKYDCPHCSEGLKSEVEKVGQQDSCPNCHRAFVVPGAELVEKLKIQLERERQEKENEERSREETRRTKDLQERQVQAELARKREISSRTEKELAARRKASSRFDEVQSDDFVSWAVHVSRRYLAALMVVGLILCVIAAIAIIGMFAIQLVMIMREDNFSIGELLTAGLTLLLGLFMCAVTALSVVVTTGIVGVFFEIEKNTRILRLQHSANARTSVKTPHIEIGAGSELVN